MGDVYLAVIRASDGVSLSNSSPTLQRRMRTAVSS
jgi:hypothetical protein